MLIGVRAPTYNHLIYHVGAPLTDSRADIHGREFVGFEQIRPAPVVCTIYGSPILYGSSTGKWSMLTGWEYKHLPTLTRGQIKH
jgi:hypothetical protein